MELSFRTGYYQGTIAPTHLLGCVLCFSSRRVDLGSEGGSGLLADSLRTSLSRLSIRDSSSSNLEITAASRSIPA